MTTKTTQSCREYSHAEFEVEYNPEYALDVDAESLLSFLAGQVAVGVRYQVGQLIQIGWMINRIDAAGNKLTLLEPDFTSFPIRFVRGITKTLKHLRLQKSVAESVGLEDRLDFPNIRQAGITCSHHLDSVDFVMDRAKPANRDSGWFIGCSGTSHNHNDPANLLRASLYELALAKPDCIQFLALPENSLVIKNGNQITVKHNQKTLIVKDGSYLADCLERLRTGK